MQSLVDTIQEGVPQQHPQASTQPGLIFRVLTCLESAEAAWRSFEQNADATVFQRFDWINEWYRHIGVGKKVIPIIVFVSNLDGEMLLLFPLAIDRRGLARLTWLSDHVCDYNGPILHRQFYHRVAFEHFDKVWRSVLDAIREHGHRFDLVQLEQMPERIGLEKNPFASLPSISPYFAAYAATLMPDWDQFYSVKVSSRKSRQTDRRKRRNLAAERGPVEFVEADLDRPEDVERTIEALIRQKQQSYVRLRVPDLFAEPGYRRFLYGLVNNVHLRDVVHLTRLDAGHEMAATGLCLRHDGRYHLWMATYDEAFGRHSPGRLHLHEMLQYAIHNKMQYFDFTVGDESYKLDWSDIRLPLLYYYEGISLRGIVYVWLQKSWQHLNTWYHEHGGAKRLVQWLRDGWAKRRDHV